MHERDAGIDRLGGGQPTRGVHVVGGIERAHGARRGEVAVLLAVAGEAAQQRGPNVPVRLDESRQHEHAGAVDDLRARRAETASHGGDGAAANVHVAAGDVANGGVHRQDVARCGSGTRCARVMRLLPPGSDRNGVPLKAPAASAPPSTSRRFQRVRVHFAFEERLHEVVDDRSRELRDLLLRRRVRHRALPLERHAPTTTSRRNAAQASGHRSRSRVVCVSRTLSSTV